MITVVMITADRTARGKSRNYLADTIANAERAGIFASQYLHQFMIFPSEYYPSDQGAWYRYASYLLLGRAKSFAVPESPYCRLPSCMNAGRALTYGGQHYLAEWVLFCEDDLDFCGDFLESVHAWLADNATESERVYSFGCAYSQLMEQAYRECRLCGLPKGFHRTLTEPYPPHEFQPYHKLTYPGLSAFYGTQCFAIRAADAISLGNYMYSNPVFPDGKQHPNSYDLMISQWVEREAIRELEDINGGPVHLSQCRIAVEQAARTIAASVPSFVQHIGKESICTDIEPGQVHEFTTWQGREWRYLE